MEKYSRYIGKGKKQISKMQMQYEFILKNRMHSVCVYVCVCVCARVCLHRKILERYSPKC